MKQFLIIGNNNAVNYLFPLIKDNKIWFGMMSNKTMEFQLDDEYEHWDRVEDGKKYGKVPSVSWYTNLTNNKRNTPLELTKTYYPTDYPKYDNYDAIEVGKVCNIPKDYDGIMGVPITFLDKYCTDQFEIIGTIGAGGIYNVGKAFINGVKKFKRILIRRKENTV